MGTGVSIDNLPDYSIAQPTWSQIIQDAVADGAALLRVCMPARVTKVRGNQLVDVQPLFKAKYVASASPTLLPQVCRCPVLAPIGASYAVILPIAVGDTGLIICADRSLDAWMSGSGNGAPVYPADPRAHVLADAIFVPGMVPENGQTTDSLGPAGTDMVLRNGNTQIRLEQNGTVRLVNSQGHELVDLAAQLTNALTQLTNILASSQTITMLGPSPTLWAASQAQLTQLQQTVATIEANLQTLRGT